MRCAPPPATTGGQEWVGDDSVDAAANGGGKTQVQVCKGEGKMVVGSEGESGRGRQGRGQSWGTSCAGRKELSVSTGSLTALQEPCDHTGHQSQLVSSPWWIAQ